jgi:hypothetical protein
MWEVLNEWLIQIMNRILTPLPSTPANYKLSALVGLLQTQFPLAPWCLLDMLVPYSLFVLSILIPIKVFKIGKP